MAETITSNTRSEPIQTKASQYFFNLRGTFGGATAKLEWAEESGGPWTTLKDPFKADVALTEYGNGTVTVGKNGYLSLLVSGGAGVNLSLSLVAH